MEDYVAECGPNDVLCLKQKGKLVLHLIKLYQEARNTFRDLPLPSAARLLSVDGSEHEKRIALVRTKLK